MQHHILDVNGITLHAVEHGQGPTVLFVHGFPDTWRGWRRQIEAGYRAVALDVRGYGQSSTPDNPALYTPFYTVDDLVGLLDAMAVPTAILVGHDFGASMAWNAAMMRPDRFPAVFCLSVPFIPPGGPGFLKRLRDAGKHDFYMFRQMRAEAESEWADAAVTIPGMLYWTSGSAPEAERWDPFNPARGLLRPSPVGVPLSRTLRMSRPPQPISRATAFTARSTTIAQSNLSPPWRARLPGRSSGNPRFS